MPKPEWNRRRYEAALYLMVEARDEEKARTIRDAYLDTEEAAEADNRHSWEAFAEYTHFRFGSGGSFAKLKTLAEAHPTSARTLEQLAKGFVQYDDHAEAARTYEAAARQSRDEAEALRLMGRAAVEHARAGAQTRAWDIIREMKSRAEATPRAELRFLGAVKDLAEIAKDDEATIAAMERTLELLPDDDEMRFLLAYKHSERGDNDLALFHYLKIRPAERQPATWNNLGVAFEQTGLSGKAVNAYRESERLDETLAMSNLAQKFMSAGFLGEAQQQCEKALKIENFHQNVASTLAELRTIPEEEDKKQAETLEKAKPRSDFYRLFGHAISRPDPIEIAPRWKGPECDLAVQLIGCEYEAVGSYERLGLGSALAGSLGLGVELQNRPDRYHVKYKGVFRGRAIEGSMSRTLEDDPTKARGPLSSVYETKVLMVLTDEGNEIQAMERPEKGVPRFYTLTKLP
jgi:Flp pilus assembly protein TadD